MNIVCPLCNTKHTRATKEQTCITCTGCGSKITIQGGAGLQPNVQIEDESERSAAVSCASRQPFPETGEAREFEFIQGNSEGMGFAGFWKRFAAALIDGCILVFLGLALGGLMGFFSALMTGTSGAGGHLSNSVGLIVGWLYYALMECSSRQGTVGKIALGIKVTDLYGRPITFARATGRHFGKFISTVIFFVGYLMVAWTAKKQGLHDMIAGCLVVTRR